MQGSTLTAPLQPCAAATQHSIYERFALFYPTHAVSHQQQYAVRPVAGGYLELLLPHPAAGAQKPAEHDQTAASNAGGIGHQQQQQQHISGIPQVPRQQLEPQQPPLQQQAGRNITALQMGGSLPPVVLQGPDQAFGPVEDVQQQLLRMARAALPRPVQVVSAAVLRLQNGDLSAGARSRDLAQALKLCLKPAAHPAAQQVTQQPGQPRQQQCGLTGQLQHYAQQLQQPAEVLLQGQQQQIPLQQEQQPQRQQQQQPGAVGRGTAYPLGDAVSNEQHTLSHGMHDVVLSVLTVLEQVVCKAFTSKQPSMALMTLHLGVQDMLLDLDLRPDLEACLSAAGAPAVDCRWLGQCLISSAKRQLQDGLAGALADYSSSSSHVAKVGASERLKLYYIAGYLVSELAMQHIEPRDHLYGDDWPVHVDGAYLECLDAVKLHSSDAAGLPDELASYASGVDQGGLTYVSVGMLDFMVELEMVVRRHLRRHALRDAAAERLHDDAVQLTALEQALNGATSTNLALYDSFARLVFDSWCAHAAEEGGDGLDFGDVQPTIMRVYQGLCGLYTKVRIGTFKGEVLF